MELLAQTGVDFRLPGLVLYPLILYVAFSGGLRTGLVAALLGVGYVLMAALLADRPVGPPDGDLWRLGMVVVGIPAAAAVVGLLRDRFATLLEREQTARAEAEAARERTHQILESISDSFLIVDGEWRLIYMNAAAERLLGRVREELYGSYAGDILSEQLDAFFQKYNQARLEGTSIQFEIPSVSGDAWYEVHAFPSEGGVTMYLRDITGHRESQEHLRNISMADELTGLYNRRGFLTLAQQQLKYAHRKRQGLLLMFIDLDGLKRINDTHGHSAGDQAIAACAAVMRSSFRDSDILGRIGGDEFAALALETDSAAGPVLLDRLHEALAEFNQRGTLPAPLSLSVGSLYFDADQPHQIEDLLAVADRRMYAQKNRGRPGDEPVEAER